MVYVPRLSSDKEGGLKFESLFRTFFLRHWPSRVFCGALVVPRFADPQPPIWYCLTADPHRLPVNPVRRIGRCADTQARGFLRVLVVIDGRQWAAGQATRPVGCANRHPFQVRPSSPTVKQTGSQSSFLAATNLLSRAFATDFCTILFRNRIQSSEQCGLIQPSLAALGLGLPVRPPIPTVPAPFPRELLVETATTTCCFALGDRATRTSHRSNKHPREVATGDSIAACWHPWRLRLWQRPQCLPRGLVLVTLVTATFPVP